MYIYAYLASFIHNNLAVCGSLDWKGENTSKAMDVASNIIDPSKEFWEFQFECYCSGMETLNENEFFIKGKYHADLFVRLLHGIELKNIPDKIKDPIMLRAKKEKDYLYYLEKHLDNFFPPNKFGDSTMAGSILGITIHKYIEGNYL